MPNTEEYLKGIQRLTGTPGNQSPSVKQIFETPTQQDPHPENDPPNQPSELAKEQETPIVKPEAEEAKEGEEAQTEDQVGEEEDAKEGDETTKKGSEKTTAKNSNTQRTGRNSGG